MLCTVAAHAQSCKTQARIITTKDSLLKEVKAHPDKGFVELKKLIPNLVLDIRYATPNNFTKVIQYYNPVVCMRIGPAKALQAVQAELNKKGLGLKVFDAFRPFGVTCHMWKMVRDKRYVANPMQGSYHNRGLAVDLTIIELKTGKELDMGTGYDNFTDSAHQAFTQLPPQVLANRAMLRELMHSKGFRIFPTEWWHYHFGDKHEYYEVIDLGFDDMRSVLNTPNP